MLIRLYHQLCTEAKGMSEKGRDSVREKGGSADSEHRIPARMLAEPIRLQQSYDSILTRHLVSFPDPFRRGLGTRLHDTMMAHTGHMHP